MPKKGVMPPQFRKNAAKKKGKKSTVKKSAKKLPAFLKKKGRKGKK